MNSEAIEWLEAQPFHFEAALNHYERIQEIHAWDICEDEFLDTMPVIQTEFFSVKRDHENQTENYKCRVCLIAEKAGALIVVGGKNE